MSRELASGLGSGVVGLVFVVVGALLVVRAFVMGVDIQEQELRAPTAEGADGKGSSPSGHRSSRAAASDEYQNTKRETTPVLTWFVSAQRDSYLRRREPSYWSAFGWVLFAVGGGIVVVGYSHSPSTGSVDVVRLLGVVVIGAGALGVVWSFVPYFAARQAYRQWRLALAAARVDEALAKACRDAPRGKTLQLPDLFQLNRRQLDEYQLITRKQQRSAVLWAQIASGVSFVVLVCGILIALSGSRDVEKFIAGGLSGLGSLLSAFVANVFFRQADEANKQMNRYYLEPQRTGRLLASERLIDDGKDWPETRQELLSSIVTTVMGWEMPPDVAASISTGANGASSSDGAGSKGTSGTGAGSKGTSGTRAGSRT